MEFNREEWLKTLKTGDKVANKVYYWSTGYYYEFLEVKSITPKGSIRLTNGVLLNNKGCYSSYERFSSESYNIEPITDEIMEAVMRRNLENNILDYFKKLSGNRKLLNEISIKDLESIKDILSRCKEDIK